MKLKTLITRLRQTQEALDTLESQGVDVNRLVGISNSQGPQGKLIQNILGMASGLLSHAESHPSQTSVKPKAIPKRIKSKNSKKS
jgi:hypothetical protein